MRGDDMRRTEIDALRGFLQQPQPGAEAARRAEQQAAGLVVEQFAREAVIALHRYEQSFDPSDRESGRRVGERFGHLWHRAGLDQADWSRGDRSDAERILVAAAELADDPGSGPSVERATSRAAQRGPVRDTADRMSADLDAAYGDHFTPSDPASWLEQSLGRLAKARVVQDMVGKDTRTRVSPDVEESADRVVQEAQRLADQRRGVDRAATKVAEAGQQRDRAVATWIGYQGVVIAVGPTPLWADIAKAVPGLFLALRAADRWGSLVDARQDHGAKRKGLAGQREKVAGAVDGVQPPGRRTGSGRRLPGGGPSR
jgi:hypothetical protein